MEQISVYYKRHVADIVLTSVSTRILSQNISKNLPDLVFC